MLTQELSRAEKLTATFPRTNLKVMDGSDLSVTAIAPPLDLRRPAEQLVPLVVASPHSGSDYPSEFVAA